MATKTEMYTQLLQSAEGLLAGQRDWVCNLANASSLIYHGLKGLEEGEGKNVNWAGFYVRRRIAVEVEVGEGAERKAELVLGPFQGRVACQSIPLDPPRGVCGEAAAQGQTLVVADVHDFPGHIACDAASQSEVVVPIRNAHGGEVCAVIDIDCAEKGGFDQVDARYLEELAEMLGKGCKWPRDD